MFPTAGLLYSFEQQVVGVYRYEVDWASYANVTQCLIVKWNDVRNKRFELQSEDYI